MSVERESLATAIPGPRSRELAAVLARTEARGVTYLGDAAPIFWESADGTLVTDVDGNRYIDLTAAFGVAGVGHSNPTVATAIAEQAVELMHGMGDVHPSVRKGELLETLARIAPLDDPRSFLCSSGAEAVEFALKTAYLATGGPDALAFGGGYHGLTLGALEVGGNPKFRRPFAAQLRQRTSFVLFPDRRERDSGERALERVDKALRKERGTGAVIVEPIQGRAGVIIPPDDFLAGLRRLCDERGVLLIVDEIYTGFGRTGTMFACERDGIRPDLLCLGKAMAGGFPISATVGTRAAMDAWEPSSGEALHTSTHLGNPMGCAAALAAIGETERLRLPARAESLSAVVEQQLRPLRDCGAVDVRGRGLMWAVEFADGERAGAVVTRALRAGIIVLQSGLRGETVTIAPPLTIAEDQLAHALEKLVLVAGDAR